MTIDDLRKKIRGCGWLIEVTELEESDSVGLFDGYNDDYVEDNYHAEKRREKEWEEEYYRRRRDPY